MSRHPRMTGNHGDGAIASEACAAAPGRSTLTARFPVQRSAADAAVVDPSQASMVATAGFSGGGTDLPYRDQIQEAFGHHDISGVRAHIGGAAADSSAALGARGYAHGTDVAFAQQPDLFLVAHEVAHVVQQRGSVQLSTADGGATDEHERHADAVAHTVVGGASAAHLLDGYSRSHLGPAVQRNDELKTMSSDDLVARARQLDATLMANPGDARSVQTARTLISIYEILKERMDRGEFRPGAGSESPLAGTLEDLAPFGNCDQWIAMSGRPAPQRRAHRAPPRQPPEPQAPSAPSPAPTQTETPDDGEWHGAPEDRSQQATDAAEVLRAEFQRYADAEFARFNQTIMRGFSPEGDIAVLEQLQGYRDTIVDILRRRASLFDPGLTTQYPPSNAQHGPYASWQAGAAHGLEAWNGLTESQRRAVRNGREAVDLTNALNRMYVTTANAHGDPDAH